jgi:hypothetical protein
MAHNQPTVSLPVVVDITAPSVPTNGQPNGTLLATNDFYFTWDDSTDASPVTYEFQSSLNPAESGGVLTSGLWHSGILPDNTIHSTGAPDGTWYWQVRAKDAAGNTSAWSPIWSVTLDTQAPAVPSLVGPADGALVTGSAALLDWSDESDAHLPVTYEYQSALNPAVDATTNGFTAYIYHAGTGTTSQIDASGSADNTYYWQVRACDAASNCSDWSGPWKVTIDSTAPSTPSITAPSAEQYFNTKPILNQWTAANDPSGIDHYQIAYVYDYGHTFGGSTCPGETISGHAVSGCRDVVGTSRNHVPALSEQGGVTIYVRAIDNAGNVGAWSAPVHYYYDATAPSIPTLATPADGSATRGIAFTQTWNPVTDAVSYDYESCNVDPGDAGAACPSVRFSGSYTGTTKSVGAGQPNGHFWWRVRAVDAAHNQSAWSEAWELTIDNDKPTSTISTFGLADGGSVTTPTWDGSVAGTASDALSGVDHVNLVISRTLFTSGATTEYWNGTAWQGTSVEFAASGADNWNYALPTPEEGTYTIASHAVDRAGNEESTYEITVIYDKTIPEVTLSIHPGSPDGENDWYTSEPEITLTANDNYHVDHIEYQLDGTAGAWQTYTAPITLPDGTYAFSYRSIDTAGNASSVGVKHVKVDTEEPDEVNNVNADYSDSPASIKLTWDTADSDIDKVYLYRGTSKTFDANSHSRIAKQDDNEESYTDTDVTPGETYYYKFVAFDRAGNKSDTRIISVETPASGTNATVTNLGTEPTGTGAVLGAETGNENASTPENGTNESANQGGGNEGEVLGASTENGGNDFTNFLHEHPWYALLILLILLGGGSYAYQRYFRKENPFA